jgi:outer membrane receptor protein involved in Fe transport
VNPETGAVDTVQGTNDRSVVDQRGEGFGVELTWARDLLARRNQVTAGAGGDFGQARFTEDSQAAAFTPSRATVGVGPFERDTDAKTTTDAYGLFVADVLHLSDAWSLSLSGRWDRADIAVRDETGRAPRLDGNHRFSRLDPAIGLSFSPAAYFTTYVAYNEGMRAPTAIELTCADPDAPCKLPTDFVADPALRKVVSHTVELGARGTMGPSSSWSAAVYRTDLDDDIQLVSSGGTASNAGYFVNVGQTRRQGLELAAGTRLGRLGLAAHYGLIDATYRSMFVEHSPANSSADARGNIRVTSGDRIPNVPQNVVQLRLDWAVTERWSVGINAPFASGVYARGDENNEDRHGPVPGYVLLNLDTRFGPWHGFELFARANNLLDSRYSSFGLVAEDFFTGPGGTFGPSAGFAPLPTQFRTPGTPRGIWIGIRYGFGPLSRLGGD